MIKSETDTAQPADERYTEKDGTQSRQTAGTDTGESWTR